MADWREFEEGRPGISVGKLPDGGEISVWIDSEPYLNTEEITDPDTGETDTSESLRVPVIPVEVPDSFLDMNGDAIETIEKPESPDDVPDDAPQYDIINSSTSFKKAMRDAFPGSTDPVGCVTTITAHQSDPNDTFSRTYSVDW